MIKRYKDIIGFHLIIDLYTAAVQWKKYFYELAHFFQFSETLQFTIYLTTIFQNKRLSCYLVWFEHAIRYVRVKKYQTRQQYHTKSDRKQVMMKRERLI